MIIRLIASASALCLIGCAAVAGQHSDPSIQSIHFEPRIFIAGDSTAADYPAERAPQIGWGQTLRYFVHDPNLIQNRAVNGRSSKSFIDEGKWSALMDEIQSGDVVLISFGHNDSRDDAPERFADPKTTYFDNLVRFAKDVRSRHGTPIILSPAARRLWEGPAMVETHGLYRENAERAAKEIGATYVDLAQLSLKYFETLGQSETKEDFLWLNPNPDHSRFPNGVEDNTHFSELGACGLSYVLAKRFLKTADLAPLIDPSRVDEQRIAPEGERPEAVFNCESWVKDRR